MNCHYHTLCLDVGFIVMVHIGVYYSYTPDWWQVMPSHVKI